MFDLFAQMFFGQRTFRGEFLKDTQMGLLLVLLLPCFRENVIVTCKVFFFLVFFLVSIISSEKCNYCRFRNQMSKWRSLKKMTIFDLLFTYLVVNSEKTLK